LSGSAPKRPWYCQAVKDKMKMEKMAKDRKKALNLTISVREAAFIFSAPAGAAVLASLVTCLILGANAVQAAAGIFMALVIGGALGGWAVFYLDNLAVSEQKNASEFLSGAAAERKTRLSVVNKTLDMIVEKDSLQKKGYTESFRDLGARAEAMNSRMSGMITAGDSLTQKMKSAKQEIKDNNENLRKVNTIVSNLAAALRAIIDEIKSISDKMAGIVSIAKAGSRMTGSEIQAMGSIKNAVSESADVINKLQATARETKNIVGTVSDMAKKTNLLSLNAGIEAARAGEAGKSFAVVAREIRELAEGATRATAEMSGFLARTEELARQAVNVISGQSRIEEAVSVVYTASDSFLHIMSSLTEISKMLSNIYSTAEEYRVDNDLLRILSAKIGDRLMELSVNMDIVFDSVKENLYIIQEVYQGAGAMERSIREKEA
jgi:methyl-accepting chemotaxis protein